jgi:hypothetical protein
MDKGITLIKKIYEQWLQESFCDNCFDGFKEKDKKLIFLSSCVFGYITDDFNLDLEFGKDTLEVIKVIYNRENFNYIKDENNYKKFITICNILSDKEWINWGTSIRGCWLNLTVDSTNPCIAFESIALTDDFLKWFIEFTEK